MHTPVKREELREQLKDLIDGYSDMKEFISDLSDICHDKADHLLSNWQDKDGADRWERLAVIFESLKINRSK